MTSGVLEPKLVSLLWAGPDRSGEIADMHALLFPDAWDVASIAKILENPAATSFVAQIGTPKITVGFIIGQIAADEAEILSIGVAPELQRRGVGRMLVEGFVRAAQRAECGCVHLEVGADNDAAFALYRGLGFVEARRRKGYYQRPNGESVDALVLKIDI
jgi:ribosomal-protein-alanine N-acetyltransferase